MANYPHVIQAIRFMPYLNQVQNPLKAGMPGTDVSKIDECVKNSEGDDHIIGEITGIYAPPVPEPMREGTNIVEGIDESFVEDAQTLISDSITSSVSQDNQLPLNKFF